MANKNREQECFERVRICESVEGEFSKNKYQMLFRKDNKFDFTDSRAESPRF